MLAQAQNADTRLTRRDIDMLLDRLQTANPESAQVAGTTDDNSGRNLPPLPVKKWANARRKNNFHPAKTMLFYPVPVRWAE